MIITKKREREISHARVVENDVLDVILFLNPFIPNLEDNGLDTILQFSDVASEGFNSVLVGFSIVYDSGLDTV